MRVAVLYKKDRVLVEFTPKKFKDLLKLYYKETKSIDKSMERIERDIRDEIKYH